MSCDWAGQRTSASDSVILTICTFHRTHPFCTDPAIKAALLQLRQRAIDHRFAIHAYRFMPQELLLLEGLSRSSALRRFVRDWKHWTTFDYRSTTGKELWQRGHVDQVLGPDEDTDVVMRYVMETPVRAGLVAHVQQYRYAGSDTNTIDDVLSRATESEARGGGRGPTHRSPAHQKHEAPTPNR